MPTKVALDELRQEIDRIDDQIHDLIIERAALAGSVASAKAARGSQTPPAAAMWRPQREAQILRRLAARHSGSFPRAAIVRIWQEIMSAMLGLEGRISVAVCAGPVPAGDQAADRPGFWDLARDHFGATVPIISFQAPGAVMRAVTDDPNLVGILPWPRDEDPDPWWRHLLGADAPRIVARLPVGDSEPPLSALAVARTTIEPSADDRSFLGIEAGEAISRTRLLSCLAAAGCEAGFVATDRERPAQPVSLHLVEVAGFVGPTDKKLAAIQEAAPDAITRAVWLGSYAVPLAAAEPVKPPAPVVTAKPPARSAARPTARPVNPAVKT
jgi:chorismate mutase-like protein